MEQETEGGERFAAVQVLLYPIQASRMPPLMRRHPGSPGCWGGDLAHNLFGSRGGMKTKELH